MKNTLKTFIFGFLALFLALTITSCGDESEDPQPQKKEEVKKTNMELVKEGIIGTWELQSIVVTDGGKDYTFNGGCDESGYPQAVKANLEDIDFQFTADGKVSQILVCQSKTVNTTYEVTEKEGKFTITTNNGSNGWKFEILTSVSDLSKKTVKINSVNTIQNVEKVIFTFKLK